MQVWQKAIESDLPVMAINITDPRPANEKIPFLGFTRKNSIATVADMNIGSTTLGQYRELESIVSSVIGGVGPIFGAGLKALLLSFIRSGLIAGRVIEHAGIRTGDIG